MSTRRATRILIGVAVVGTTLTATACDRQTTSEPSRSHPSTAPAPVGPAPRPPVSTGPVPAATRVPATSTAEPAQATFAILPGRHAEAERAGLGWLLDVDDPPQPPGVPWPTATWPTGPLPGGVDADAVRAVVDDAFTPMVDDAGNEIGKVDAVVVVSGGRLVLEAYNDWAPEAPHPSWSMAKSITQAMIGILVGEGRLDPYGPAPVPEWAAPDDPRHAITIDELLHMRSGLQWDEEYTGDSDVIEVLFGDGRADRGHYAADKPLEDTPDAAFHYSTGNSLILSRIVADQVGHGDAGTTWAQAALFGPLGISTVSHDLDGRGVMNGGAHIDMTAQDFARFGLLYLRGGTWDGQQIVPAAWVDDARLPRADRTDYGASWWVLDDPRLGRVSFGAAGYAGQSIRVVPTLDLVVVVLANEQLGRADAAASAIVDQFAAARGTP